MKALVLLAQAFVLASCESTDQINDPGPVEDLDREWTVTDADVYSQNHGFVEGAMLVLSKSGSKWEARLVVDEDERRLCTGRVIAHGAIGALVCRYDDRSHLLIVRRIGDRQCGNKPGNGDAFQKCMGFQVLGIGQADEYRGADPGGGTGKGGN